MKTKAVLFDVDGTLLDTHEYIYQAFEHSLGKHHKPLMRKEIQKIMGKPLDECYQILTKLENISHFADSHRSFQLSNPDLVKPFPNTITTLEALKKKGLLIAAVTTRAKASVQVNLDMTGLIHYLNYVVTFEDVTLPKPDPEGIRKALRYFELKPEEAIMVGDSDVDVLAGKNAGTKTVGVTYGFHGERISQANPDYVVHDIKEILKIF